MLNFKINPAAKKAIFIGSMCSISYLAVYVARNVLSAVSPQMIEGGEFTTEQIGPLSSIYFICYAFGQLINGFIGDRIKTKYMISFGLGFAGVCNLLFSVLHNVPMAIYIVYGLSGFFLSMIYGPMTKVVAENTEPVYATRCSLGYTFASFFGSPLAGFLGAIMAWNRVFNTASLLLLIMSIICFIFFTVFEKRGLIEYNKYNITKEKGGGLQLLIKRKIAKYTIVSIVTGVVKTTVVFWLPTYISQYLGFSPEKSAILFTVATFAISATPFIAIFIYERLKMNMELTLLVSFVSAAVFFLSVYIIKQPILNILFMVLSIMASNCAATMMWSRYCPSLRDTGMVSTATGFLDFVSYTAASISSTLFSSLLSSIGWRNLILIWFGLMIAGVAVAFPYGKLKKS